MDAGDGDSVACIRSLTTLEDEEVQKEKSLDDYDRWNIICHKDTPLRQRVALLGDGLADVRLWRLPFAKPLELPESVVVMHSMKTIEKAVPIFSWQQTNLPRLLYEACTSEAQGEEPVKLCVLLETVIQLTRREWWMPPMPAPQRVQLLGAIIHVSRNLLKQQYPKASSADAVRQTEIWIDQLCKIQQTLNCLIVEDEALWQGLSREVGERVKNCALETLQVSEDLREDYIKPKLRSGFPEHDMLPLAFARYKAGFSCLAILGSLWHSALEIEPPAAMKNKTLDGLLDGICHFYVAACLNSEERWEEQEADCTKGFWSPSFPASANLLMAHGKNSILAETSCQKAQILKLTPGVHDAAFEGPRQIFIEVLAQLVLDHREEGDVKTLRHWLEFWQILIAAFLKPFPLSSRSRALDGLLKRMVAVVKTLRDLVKVKQGLQQELGQEEYAQLVKTAEQNKEELLKEEEAVKMLEQARAAKKRAKRAARKARANQGARPDADDRSQDAPLPKESDTRDGSILSRPPSIESNVAVGGDSAAVGGGSTAVGAGGETHGSRQRHRQAMLSRPSPCPSEAARFPEEEDEDEASEPSLSNYLRTLGLRNVPDNAEAYPLEDRRSRSHHAGSSAMKQSEMLPAESMAHGMSLDFAEPLRMSAGQPSTIHSDPETDTDGDWLQVRRKRSARRAKAARSEMSVEDSILSGGPLLSAEELEDMCTCPITCEIMTDPVMTVDGHTYERAGISDWLATHHTSPATNEVLVSKDLKPNLAILKRIKANFL